MLRNDRDITPAGRRALELEELNARRRAVRVTITRPRYIRHDDDQRNPIHAARFCTEARAHLIAVGVLVLPHENEAQNA